MTTALVTFKYLTPCQAFRYFSISTNPEHLNTLYLIYKVLISLLRDFISYVTTILN